MAKFPLHHLETLIKGAATRLRPLVNHVRGRLGGRAAAAPVEERVGDDATEVTLPSRELLLRHTRTLPQEYVRLFSDDPVTDAEPLGEQEAALKALQAAHDRWVNNPVSVALVGDDGVGKSTVIDAFLRGAPSPLTGRIVIPERLRTVDDVLRLLARMFDVDPPPDTAESLVAALVDRPRQVILLEGGHNLMLRAIGGWAAPKAFLRILRRTRDHTFWIMPFETNVWRHLCHCIQIDQRFDDIIFLDALGPEAIRDMILRRQNASAYKLSFALPDAGDAKDSDAYEQQFFKALWQASGGRSRAALSLWLWCCSVPSEGEGIVVSRFPRLDASALGALPQASLLVLGSLFSYGALEPSEVEAIFQIGASGAGDILDELEHAKLIEAVPAANLEGRAGYRINPMVFSDLAAFLHRRNILY